jgi:hypothetical protein
VGSFHLSNVEKAKSKAEFAKKEPKKQKNAPKSAENDDKKVIQAFIEACGGEAELSRILRAFLMSL